MTSEAATIGLTHGGSEDTGLGHRGPQSKSIVVPYGFWLFILSDIILFSALFATYATLVHATAGGPAGKDLFNLRNVGIETVSLLLSSFTCGLALIAWSWWIRMQLRAVDRGGIARLKRVAAALIDHGEIAAWQAQAQWGAVLGPVVLLVALWWWRVARRSMRGTSPVPQRCFLPPMATIRRSRSG